MELISQLETVLRPELLQGLETGNSLILEERQRNQDDTKVELIGVSSPFLAVRMDKLNHLSALKPERERWNQICDYLLIGQSNGSDYAILVELKTTLGERTKAKGKEQLLRSLPILEYLLSVCAAEYGSSEKSNLTIRYVLIAEKEHSKIYKRGSQRGRQGQLRQRQEPYKSIKVATFVEPTVHFAALAQG